MKKLCTANNIPHLDNKIAIVTGANSGLGFHTTLQLAKHGATVIMACKNLAKGQAAIDSILMFHPHAKLILMELDLASLNSIHRFTEKCIQNFDKLSLLINNAGLMAIPYRKTVDNFEMQFGVNHLGHFALTGLLLPLLMKENHPRVVTVSSIYYKLGKIAWDNLQGEQKYQARLAYCNSKLANLLFAFELHRRAHDTGLISVAVHPGYSDTNLQYVAAEMEGNLLKKYFRKLTNVLFAQSAAMGALPSLYGATAHDVKGGDFIGPAGLLELHGHPTHIQANKKALDAPTAKQLWEISEALTKVHYPF